MATEDKAILTAIAVVIVVIGIWGTLFGGQPDLADGILCRMSGAKNVAECDLLIRSHTRDKTETTTIRTRPLIIEGATQ